MGRIICIDYGSKKCGIAVTDPLQIIVNALTTVPTIDLEPFVVDYLKRESVDKLVFGYPRHKDGTETSLVPSIQKFETSIKNMFPDLQTDYWDEANSSRKAKEIILASGLKQKKRRDKALVDRISAVVILQEYLGHYL